MLKKDLVINNHPVFMAQHTAYGHADLMMFLDSSGRWRICSKSKHYDAKTQVCYVMGIGFAGSMPITKENGTGSWETFNDGHWKPCKDAMTIPIKPRSEDFLGVKLENLDGKAGQESLNGKYILKEGLVINNHPVYMFEGTAYSHTDLMMFCDDKGGWRIASKSEHYDKGTDICYAMGWDFDTVHPILTDDMVKGSWETYVENRSYTHTHTHTLPFHE